LGGGVEDQETDQGHPGLVLLGQACPETVLADRDTQRAKALAGEFLESAVDAAPHPGCLEGDGSLRRLDMGADAEDRGQGAFGHHQARITVLDEDAQALADEVVGDLAELPIPRDGGGDLGGRLGADGLVDGVLESGLQEGVQVGVGQHPLAVVPLHVKRRTQAHQSFGKGSRLVGAEHVHGAEVLDGRQPLDDDAGRGHAPGAVGQVDGDNRREKLGGEPDGEGQREEQRVQHRAVEIDVGREDGQDENQGDLHQEIPHPSDPSLEIGLGGAEPEALGDLPELRVGTGGHHERRGRTAHRVGAKEERVRPPSRRGVGIEDPG